MYEENSCIIEDDVLPAANYLSDILEYRGHTYPTHILARRVNLLTDAEKRRCDKAWSIINKQLEKIDDIISERAEKENDPWE